MNDRLLSEQELQDKFCKSCVEIVRNDCHLKCQHSLAAVKENLLEAQDLKTAAAVNAEWVEWVGQYEDTEDLPIEYDVVIPVKDWQERKRSLL